MNFSKQLCLGQQWGRLLDAAKRTVKPSIPLSCVRREWVSHASRTDCTCCCYTAVVVVVVVVVVNVVDDVAFIGNPTDLYGLVTLNPLYTSKYTFKL